jgi:hypothetical protein
LNQAWTLPSEFEPTLAMAARATAEANAELYMFSEHAESHATYQHAVKAGVAQPVTLHLGNGFETIATRELFDSNQVSNVMLV